MIKGDIRFTIMNFKKAKYYLLLPTIGLTALAVTFLFNNSYKPLKYILQWTSPSSKPFKYLGVGQTTFIERNCYVQNCFVTSNKSYFKDMRDFDAILFHGPEISTQNLRRPKMRSTKQIYIYVNRESPSYYPVCQRRYFKFFNWTWTYKLKSDILFNYFIIRNNQGKVIGPKKEMHWLKAKDMLPVSDEIKNKLNGKSKTAAWFISNCSSKSKRETFVKKLQAELEQYGLKIDIYGKCGTQKCDGTKHKKCWEMVERDYYFYFSLENSFSEDYVTEKLLFPLQHYTIPIVHGVANYTRFMPDGSYLNGMQLGLETLARKMFEITKDKKRHQSFFKWRQHYSYHDPEEKPETDPYCRLCAMLNDKDATNKGKMYRNFKAWWNQRELCEDSYNYQPGYT